MNGCHNNKHGFQCCDDTGRSHTLEPESVDELTKKLALSAAYRCIRSWSDSAPQVTTHNISYFRLVAARKQLQEL